MNLSDEQSRELCQAQKRKKAPLTVDDILRVSASEKSSLYSLADWDKGDDAIALSWRKERCRLVLAAWRLKYQEIEDCEAKGERDAQEQKRLESQVERLREMERRGSRRTIVLNDERGYQDVVTVLDDEDGAQRIRATIFRELDTFVSTRASYDPEVQDWMRGMASRGRTRFLVAEEEAA